MSQSQFTPPTEGEVAELVAKLRRLAPQNPLGIADPTILRAVDLLERCHPAPVPPAEGEVGELVKRLRDWHTIPTLEERARAAELLQQQHPAPVPVSERLPGDQLCWWYEPDEDDGYGGRWTLLRIRGGTATYTHWLPATALPLPAKEVEE